MTRPLIARILRALYESARICDCVDDERRVVCRAGGMGGVVLSVGGCPLARAAGLRNGRVRRGPHRQRRVFRVETVWGVWQMFSRPNR